MDSRFHGVPISATQTSPKAAPSFKGIRAPLTVDDTDFKYSASPKSRRNSTTSSYYSESELESEGFASGEDESESVSEGVHVVEKDEGVLEGAHFVDEFAFSEPSVRSPDENFVKESGDVSGNAVLRPFVDGNFDDSDGSRSFLSESGDEIVDDESYVAYSRPLAAVKHEEVPVSGPSPMVDVRIPVVQTLHIPIAQISADSDDDSQGSGVLDEEGFSGIVRVPSFEILHRINSTPKVSISGSDEGDEPEFRAKIIEFVEDLAVNNAVLGPSDEKEHFDVEDSVHHDVSGDMIQDKGEGIDKEIMTDLLVVNEESEITSESRKNGDFMHLDEEIQEIDVNNEQKKCVELVDHGSDSEQVESENEHEIGSIHRFVDIKEVPELPESLTESVQVYMSDSLFKDASLNSVIDASESVFEGSVSNKETKKEAENSDRLPSEVEESSFCSDIKAMVAEMNRVPDSTSSSNVEILLDPSQKINGQINTEFHEVNADILSLESNSDDISSLCATRPVIAERNSDNFVHLSTNGVSEEALSETEKKKIEKMKQIRVKYLRLLQRLGRSPEDSVASKVLCQLALAEEGSSSQNLDSKAAMELEAHGDEDLDFSLSILVIGKTGVGKSATINSIFGERKTVIDAFEPATTRVEEIVGKIHGVKLKVFDTPGLRTSLKDQSINGKILSSIKNFIRKCPPDVILYVDRLDAQTDHNDILLLKSFTSYLGSSIWSKFVVALTHGTSIPPDGPNGCPLSYEVFIAQKLRVIQQLISRSVLMNSGSMVPICLVENHPFANGESWRSQLLLLCCSMKTLSEFSSSALSYLLSSFLQLDLGSSRNGVGDEASIDQETGASETATVSLHNPSSRYCISEPLRPVLDSHGWDHDCGYDGVFIEDKIDIADDYPAVILAQLRKNFRKNKTTVTFLDENVVSRLELEDHFAVYGADQTSLGLSITRHGGDLICGCNLHSQFYVGGNSKLNVDAALNSKFCGKISIKTSCSDQLHVAAIALVLIARSIFKKRFGQSTED